jgi:DNA-binding beta-propeller fold protein YncE
MRRQHVCLRMTRLLGAILLAGLAVPASAQVAVCANDGKAVLANGETVVPPMPKPDSVLILDLAGKTPRAIGEVAVPTSAIGPPQSVAISPDGRFALVTAATKIDPADPTKTVPDDKVSVIDLVALKAVQTLEAGPGASGVSINPAGTLALVANRSEDTVSVFAIEAGTLKPMGKVFFPEDSSPSLPVFTPDGSKVLLTRDGDSRISVLSVAGDKVADTGYAIYAGLRPYAIEMAARGDVAVVANIGVGGRDTDSLSLIDVQSNPMHVTFTVSVPPSPEGLALSADGKFVAASSINGSNFAPGTPGYHDGGVVTVFAREGFALRKVAEVATGRWCEGLVWSTDHRKLLVQCMVENEIQVFSFDGRSLKRTGAIPVANGPAGLRVAYNVAAPGLAVAPAVVAAMVAGDNQTAAKPVKGKKSKATKAKKTKKPVKKKSRHRAG